MNEPYHGSTDELLDSFTPYEVAVLSFTSPKVVKNIDEGNDIVTLTGKDAYLWAGAIAHAIMRNADLNSIQIVTKLHNAFSMYKKDRCFFDKPYGVSFRSSSFLPETGVLEAFISELDISDERELIYRRTEDAVRSLIWRGHIVDPFNKKVGAAIISVILIMPIGFTSVGSKEVQLNALTWEYVQRAEKKSNPKDVQV